MGQEFELKYAAGPEVLETLKVRYPDHHPITMETTYYDDPLGRFSKLHWTLRRRMENGVSVCALKTPGKDLVRGEWEIECDDIQDAIPRLCEQGAPLELLLLTAQGIAPVCGARFTRLACPIELEDARLELALDAGVFIGGGQEVPFQEVEVELKEGPQSAARTFGEALQSEFGLSEEHRSKVARARALAIR